MKLVQGAVVRKTIEMCSTRIYQYRHHLRHEFISPHYINNIKRPLLLELVWLTNDVLNYVPSDYISR